MFTEGIHPIGDGLLDIDEARLKNLLVQDDINDIYEVEQTPFARGKFAAVRRAIHKNSGVHFAAKFLKRRRRAQSSDKEIKHEIAVLTLCDGAENIVKLNAVHETRSDTALLLELATGGELQTFLDNEECLSEAHARFCMREVLKALQFLHKRSIAHLDLKPQNILLIGERIEDGLKLCDFGISRVVVEGTNVREIVGTPDYVAPEVLQYEPLSLLTDIWSVGVLAYVLLSGFSPFGGETKQETFLNISQCALTFPDKLFGGVSAAAIDFIRRSLRIKPSERMTAAACLEHIWLKDDCSIDRHLFENGKTLADLTDDENDEDDDDEEADLIDEHDVSIEEDATEDDHRDNLENSSEENCSMNDGVTFINGSNNKMDSSDNELDQPCNGMGQLINGGTKKTANRTTKTTTAVHTVPASRATTIPLCHTQSQQQPTNSFSRRHSESNKENTYLTTKKIMPTNNVIKKPTAAVVTTNKSTATIIIGTEYQQPQHPQNEQSEANNVIATILLPNGSSNINSGNSVSAPSFFPDAPTTPKVIRKAPTTDTSPTSVKALVKKFQLEVAEKHLKETQVNQLHPPQSSICNPSMVAMGGGRKSLPSITTNGKFLNGSESNTSKKIPAQQSTDLADIAIKNFNCQDHYYELQEKTTNKSSSSNNNNSKHISNIKISNGCNKHSSNRRLSEPITVVYLQKKSSAATATAAALSSSPPLPQSPLSVASDTAMSYKTTCVYCMTCGGSTHANCVGGECDGKKTSSSNGCRHSSTANAINSGSSCSRNPTTTATSQQAAAILLQHHHQHPHHHHHHHVVVAKSAAANNLNLDQGIIC